MKFTVLYGKREARLELRPSTTLSELAAGLAERFSLPDPAALKFRLQEGQPSLRVRDYPTATLESAGAVRHTVLGRWLPAVAACPAQRV